MNLAILPRPGQVARAATWGVWGMQGTWWAVGTGLGSGEGWADWERGDVTGCCRCCGGKRQEREEMCVRICRLQTKMNHMRFEGRQWQNYRCLLEQVCSNVLLLYITANYAQAPDVAYIVFRAHYNTSGPAAWAKPKVGGNSQVIKCILKNIVFVIRQRGGSEKSRQKKDAGSGFSTKDSGTQPHSIRIRNI